MIRTQVTSVKAIPVKAQRMMIQWNRIIVTLIQKKKQRAVIIVTAYLDQRVSAAVTQVQNILPCQ